MKSKLSGRGIPKWAKILVVFLVVLSLLFIFAPARYSILNFVGIRGSLRLTVIDGQTQQPLRNVRVSVGSVEQTSGIYGEVELDDLKLGRQTLAIEKSAYQTIHQTITVGLSEANLGSLEFTPIGVQYHFLISDWLSLEPIAGDVSVTYQQTTALADGGGAAVINILPVDSTTVTFNVEATGYLPQLVEVPAEKSGATKVSLVIAQPHYYISQRNGRYNIYRSQADGNNEELLVEGSGNETSDIRFSQSPDNTIAVLAASRDEQYDSDGHILNGLYVIDLSSGELQKIDSSQRIDFIGWSGDDLDRLIYLKVTTGSAADDPQRQRLMSYDTSAHSQTQLAASNYFNDILVSGRYVFYVPSAAYEADPKPYLFRVLADGGDLQTVYPGEVWTVLQKNPSTITFDALKQWYDSPVDQLNPTESVAPQRFVSRLYIANTYDNNISVWSEISDGQGQLHVYNAREDEDRVLRSQAGLRYPIHWLDATHLVFRTVTDTESADYIYNIEGGQLRKINDVNDVSGVERWYFYY